MSLVFYGHPFSSYCQKVLIALYENATPFQWKVLGPDDPQAGEEFQTLWPLRRMPLLVDAGQAVSESSIIIEYLSLAHPGPVRLIPADPRAALDVRFMDRFFDNYISTPMQAIVADRLRPQEHRDSHGVERARASLDTAYRWLDGRIGKDPWSVGDAFTMADCSAAPALFYADWTHPIPTELANLRAYRARLLAKPSFGRAVEEARPYRPFFPLGAPDRD